MTTVADIATWMAGVAPLELSEEWDNTGLLLGDPGAAVARIQTCLTLTPESAAEAVEGQADMVIVHHPMPFRPLAKLTTETPSGQILWQLARAGISVYSPHTAWDSAAEGINSLLAQHLGLANCRPLIPAKDPLPAAVGAGRMGELSSPCQLDEIAQQLRQRIPECRPRAVAGRSDVQRLGIACGSGGSLLSAAVRQGCDGFITGEATFHTCLEAQAHGIGLLLIGHFASEQFSLQILAERLARSHPHLRVWFSKTEKDPVRNLV